MAYCTNIHHYDIHASDLLPGSESFLTLLAEDDASAATLNIPFWQRNYDWDNNQILNFLSSISNSVKHKKELYLGTLVLGIHSDYPGQIIVIDGQQRLRSIQNLIIISQSLFNYKKKSQSIPLIHGLGKSKTILQGKEAIYKSFSSVKQEESFSKSSLQNKGFDHTAPLSWLPLIHLRIIVAKFEAKNKVGTRVVNRNKKDPFDLVMSTLFANINRQAKPLEDIDVVKAKLLFRLQQSGLEDESAQFAEQWETARMLQLVPTQSACREILHETSILNSKFDKVITAIPYAPETVRVQFSRYLLLVEAFARNAQSPADRERKDILKVGEFAEHFEKLCINDDLEYLLSFCNALKTINNLYLDHHDFLLLSRRNHMEDDEKPLSSLPDEKRRLLIFQAYISSGTSSPNWLAHPMLMQLLTKLSQVTNAKTETLSKILVQLETKLFERLCDNTSVHMAITARDWFLWRALFDTPDNNPAYDLAVKGCAAMISSAPSRFKASSGEELLASLRAQIRPSTVQIMPTSTGADEVEHWVALDRGRLKEKDLEELYERLANKAHIASGLNQAMRNDGILKKAGHLDQYWWPTLQFLAAYSICGKKWAVADDSLNKKNLSAFLKPLEIFWQTVSAPFVSESPRGPSQES